MQCSQQSNYCAEVVYILNHISDYPLHYSLHNNSLLLPPPHLTDSPYDPLKELYTIRWGSETS